MSRSCATCIHFHPALTSVDNICKGSGECRVNPPTVASEDCQPFSPMVGWRIWPAVHGVDWCSVWAPRSGEYSR
jgi:hypothetical protein